MKLTPGDNCHGWSSTMPRIRMVNHHPKDDHPPEGSVILTWNLAPNSLQMTTAMDAHTSFLGWSPTNQGWSPVKRKYTSDLKFGT